MPSIAFGWTVVLLIIGYVLEKCQPREPNRLIDDKEKYYSELVSQASNRNI